jgi:hypothetical protein
MMARQGSTSKATKHPKTTVSSKQLTKLAQEKEARIEAIRTRRAERKAARKKTGEYLSYFIRRFVVCK